MLTQTLTSRQSQEYNALINKPVTTHYRNFKPPSIINIKTNAQFDVDK